jgi:hypothetical protein
MIESLLLISTPSDVWMRPNQSILKMEGLSGRSPGLGQNDAYFSQVVFPLFLSECQL